MNILERIGKLLESNINAMLSKAEDPEKMLEQLMLDMREQYRAAQRQVTLSIADEKRLDAKYRKEKAAVDEWQRRAVLALQKGKEDLAREALLRKQENAAAAQEYLTQLEQQSILVEKLKESLVALDRKIDEAARKKDLILARQKRAEAAQTINRTVSGLDDKSAFEAFDQMEEKVASLEARTEAEEEITALGKKTDLDEQFKALETADVDTELAALKAQLGLALPTGGTPQALPPEKKADEKK